MNQNEIYNVKMDRPFRALTALISLFLFLSGTHCWSWESRQIANNIYYGFPACSLIFQNDLSKLSLDRSCPNFSSQDSSRAAIGILQEAVFDSARKIYLEKHSCVRDFTSKLTGSPEALNEYRRTLMVVWLNRKKAQLILKECSKWDAALAQTETRDKRKFNSESYSLSQSEKAEFLARVPGLKTEFFSVCNQPARRRALEQLVRLANKSTPFLSSEGALELMEKNRQLLLSASTRQPLTDSQILHLNLKSEDPIVFPDPALLPSFLDKIKSHLQIESSRDSLSMELERGFTQVGMEKLFLEGSANDAMVAMGLVPKDLSEEEKTLRVRHGLPPQTTAEDPDVVRMRNCLKVRYEPNVMSDAIESIVLFIALKRAAPEKIKELLARVPALGSSLYALGSTAPQTMEKCLDRLKKGRIFKTAGQSGNLPGFMNVAHLPPGFDWDFFEMKSLSMSSVASCQNQNLKRAFFEKADQISCAKELILNSFPLSVGIPASLVL